MKLDPIRKREKTQDLGSVRPKSVATFGVDFFRLWFKRVGSYVLQGCQWARRQTD